MHGTSTTPPRKAPGTVARIQQTVAFVVGACALATTASCASVAVYNPEHLAPDELSQIGAVCQTAMGLPDGLYTQHYACVESLSHSFAARLNGGRLLAARQDCLAQGLSPGTAALSDCELPPRPQRVAEEARPAPATALPAPPARSYFGASFDEIRRREQRACAEIGYDPVSAGFGQCVADLAAYLYEADHPVD